ncbi:MAG: GNAT family N-acetyltransferase [Terracidiphilus sp.]
MATQEAKTRPIHLEEITTTSAPGTVAQAQELLLEYGCFVISQPECARFCYGSLEKEAARLPHSYHEQGGGCLLAHALGKQAGFVAWRTLPTSVAPHAWELKRLWVRPNGRGLGLGRALTQAVLDRAAVAGCKAVYLDTVPASMDAAYRLYRQMGFEPCAPYNDNPVEELAYLVKHL